VFRLRKTILNFRSQSRFGKTINWIVIYSGFRKARSALFIECILCRTYVSYTLYMYIYIIRVYRQAELIPARFGHSIYIRPGISVRRRHYYRHRRKFYSNPEKSFKAGSLARQIIAPRTRGSLMI